MTSDPTKPLDSELSWWEKQACAQKSDAGLIAFGVASGLKLAKKYHGAQNMTIMHETNPELSIGGIWLLRDGDHIIVRAEIGGSWIDVIRERHDGMFSHIVEPSGMRKAAKVSKP